MTERRWQPWPEALEGDEALAAAVISAHDDLLRGFMATEPSINPQLPVQVRAFRHVEGWRVMLLLTPWMLVRLLFPDRTPELGVPAGWGGEERENAPYQVLGPILKIKLLGHSQTAHLGFHPGLGHYLLQPICLDMEPYRNADAVFEAWNRVILVRDENMEKARRDCPMQREVSRRELLTRFRRG